MHFTVDTEQSALQWRRAFEAAIFRNARALFRKQFAGQKGKGVNSLNVVEDPWTMLRCCIPLDRTTVRGVQDFHSFSTLVGLDVRLDREAAVDWNPERLPFAEKDPFRPKLQVRSDVERSQTSRLWSPRSPPSSRTHSPSRKPSRQATEPIYVGSSGPMPMAPLIGYRGEASYAFNVAVLNEQSWFADALTQAIEAAHLRHYKIDARQPDVVLNVAGHDCLSTDEAEEAEEQKSIDRKSSESLDEPTTLVQQIGKAEKAAMAAKVFGLDEHEEIYRELSACILG